MQCTQGKEPLLQHGATNPSFQQPYFTTEYNYLEIQEEFMVVFDVCEWIYVKRAEFFIIIFFTQTLEWFNLFETVISKLY
jgi:hypothetical protein